jgi:hypothetical protein
MPDDEPAEIELSACHYSAPCRVRACRAQATIIARSVDAAGRPMRQYELCDVHADQVDARERRKWRKVASRNPSKNAADKASQ